MTNSLAAALVALVVAVVVPVVPVVVAAVAAGWWWRWSASGRELIHNQFHSHRDGIGPSLFCF